VDLLITIFTLVAAIYAVMPRDRQLELRLRVGPADWALLLAGFLFVLYLEFYDFFLLRGLVFSRPWPRGLTPRNSMYLVMLVVISIVGARIRFSHLTKGKMLKFRELVEELSWKESYGELLTLFQRHVIELFRIYESKFFLSRVRRLLDRHTSPRMEDTISQFLAISETTLPRRTHPVRERIAEWSLSSVRPLLSSLKRFLPDDVKSQEFARDVVRTLLLSPRFVGALAKTRPYLAIEVMEKSRKCQERFDFIDIYLKALIDDHQSVLYSEIRNNQNCTSYRYFLAPSNRLLFFLLSDPEAAKEDHIYKPIGDYALSYLDELARDSRTDPYNRAMGDFEDVGAWQSPLFVTIRFFDIMVKEALFRGMEWHMWLYYIPDVVRGMARNYRLNDPLADPLNEWPIRYSFLLYQAFSAMRDWIVAVEDIPADQPNIVLKSTGTDHENGNIPKSSILALAESARHVLESDHIPARQKNYLLDMVFHIYFRLRPTPTLEPYAVALRNAVSDGGFFRRHDDRKYRIALQAAFGENKREYLIKNSEAYVYELQNSLS